jgi:hypothetical protein
MKSKNKVKPINATTIVKGQFAKEVEIQANTAPSKSAVERSQNALNLLRKVRGA